MDNANAHDELTAALWTKWLGLTELTAYDVAKMRELDAIAASRGC